MPQVYTVDLAGLEYATPGWLGLLDKVERARADRFFKARDRLAFIAAHTLKRVALAQALPGRDAKALQFDVDPYGKPFLAEQDRVPFSLSHTNGLVALALSSQTDLGVDVEALGSPIPHKDAMRSILSAAESAALTYAADLENTFLVLWTAKEAVAKAEGKGFSLQFSEIEVHHDHAQGLSLRWKLWWSRPTPGHILALAWDEREGAVDMRALRGDELTAWVECQGEGVGHRMA
ncbi:4'-phosphopantetheinyl transferase [Rhizomicrobium palustre]|jgi:4'-phosphopantetheinyl transferase|uniref:4'-phosphopantetheinyl transferase n=1 Tax=Rhizomicrobium palustre TaxID=189966 RepID=A0A846MVV9_9PROT|nr:4'-phosphopantetheinyl transferase superfamily protein [Rhizomicrobium palustre]NIK87137.1 4'-phosphopantetheinyl transferase [Rhizomicrobium palustre]